MQYGQISVKHVKVRLIHGASKENCEYLIAGENVACKFALP